MKLIHSLGVTRWLDPRVHLLGMEMDCWAKSSNNVVGISGRAWQRAL